MNLVLLLLAEALLAVDWRQTLTIARNPFKYWEVQIDKIIGRDPSVRSVCAWFGFWAAAIGVATLTLPAALSWLLPVVVIAMEAPTVLANKKLFGAWW